MKDILLKITGKTIKIENGQENSEDLIEMITEGRYASRDGITRLEYLDTEMLGNGEEVHTAITVTSQKVLLKRISKNLPTGTLMEFQEGKRYAGKYDTPYGPINIEIYTNEILADDFDNRGAKLQLDYNIWLTGLEETHTKLQIERIN